MQGVDDSDTYVCVIQGVDDSDSYVCVIQGVDDSDIYVCVIQGVDDSDIRGHPLCAECRGGGCSDQPDSPQHPCGRHRSAFRHGVDHVS